jgi:hypothetical protein
MLPAVPANAGPHSATVGIDVAVSQPTGSVIGADGRLYAALADSTVRVSDQVIGPPGAGIATIQLPSGTLAVFTIGSQGGLVIATTDAAGSGLQILRVGPGNLARPGGRISAAVGPAGGHIFFAGNNGAIYDAPYPPQAGLPRQITPAGLVPPTASVAAFRQGSSFGTVFAGWDGGLHTTIGRPDPSGAPSFVWTTTLATPVNVTAPGSPVAATSLGGAFYTTTDGRLWRLPIAGAIPVPRPPIALSAAGTVPVGAHLAAFQAPSGEFGIAYAGADGAIAVFTNVLGPQPVPWTISPAGTHVPGGPLSVGYESDHLYFGWCGVDRWFWLNWWWLRRPPPPPPPPPDPYHELSQIPSTIPLQQNYQIGVTSTS